jgi:hypothetical protein
VKHKIQNGFRHITHLLTAAFICYGFYAAIQTYLKGDTPLLSKNLETEASAVARFKSMPSIERNRLIVGQQLILQSEPLNKTAIINLSLLFRSADQNELANKLIKSASALSLRDSKLAVSALQLHIQSGEFIAALTSIDALLLTHNGSTQELFSTLASLTSNPLAKTELVYLLAHSPPWRIPFLNWLAQNSDRPELAFDLLTELKSGKARISHWEVMVLVRRYIVDKRFDTAYFVWLSLLPDYQLREVRSIFDGEFDLPLSSFFFDWTVVAGTGVSVDTIPRTEGSYDKVLRVQLKNDRDIVGPIYQLLRMPRGKYVFTGSYNSWNVKTESGLIWRIRCVEGDQAELAIVPISTGSNQWERFQIGVDVHDSCPTQKLSLEMRTSAVLDQKISGIAYFDSFQINPKESSN